MLIATPEKIASSTAWSPAGVPGILMKTFGLLTRRERNVAAASVPSSHKRARANLKGHPTSTPLVAM